MRQSAIIEALLNSSGQFIRYLCRRETLGEDPAGEELQSLQEVRNSLVSWGGVSTQKMNEWVMVTALSVLKKAGRSIG